MGTRREVRERLAAIFAGQGFTQVYDYAPLDLMGATKVLAIYSKASRLDIISADLQNNFYLFNLDVLIKRVGAGNVEDDLDTLHDVIATVIRANVGDDTWSHLELSDDSDCFFAELAGTPYRLERHALLVKVTGE